MGSLILPSSGPLYVDTQVLIYSVEHHPVYAPVLRPVWQAAQAGTHEIVTSELSILETLVVPLRRGDGRLVADYEALFQQPGIRLLPITQQVLREAARLRATVPSLRTPDAIHAATAASAACPIVLSNDRDLRRVPGLPLTLLDDLVGP